MAVSAPCAGGGGAMLILRPEQMKALSEPVVREYTKKTVAWIRKDFPGELEARGEAGVEALVQKAVRKAAGYGLSSSTGVTGLLSLMILSDPFKRLTVIADEKAGGSRLYGSWRAGHWDIWRIETD